MSTPMTRPGQTADSLSSSDARGLDPSRLPRSLPSCL